MFDPPLIVNESVSSGFMARYGKEISEGDAAAALVTAMLGGQMGPPFMTFIPRRLLIMMTKMMMVGEEKRAEKDDVTMRMLAPTVHYDFNLSFELKDKHERYGEINTEMLLIGAGKSPNYFKVALDTLAKTIPNTKRIQFPGLHHGATGNTNRGGKPYQVAQELIRFFNGGNS